MKKLILILFLIIPYFANSQVNYDDNLNLGGYCGAIVSCRPVGNKVGIFSTGMAGIIIKNHRLGGFYTGLTNRYSDVDKDKKSFKYSCYSGGVYYGYPFAHSKTWHTIADIRIGYGVTHMIDTDWKNIKVANFIGLTPSFGVECILTDYFLVSFALEYNYSSFFNVESQYLVGNVFNRLGLGISLKIGQFY